MFVVANVNYSFMAVVVAMKIVSKRSKTAVAPVMFMEIHRQMRYI
uniref:Uncharacterized protein n=1 Tax=Parascaris equorum TaxID=6256 RepID=A0A914RDV5_PAREQ